MATGRFIFCLLCVSLNETTFPSFHFLGDRGMDREAIGPEHAVGGIGEAQEGDAGERQGDGQHRKHLGAGRRTDGHPCHPCPHCPHVGILLSQTVFRQ